MFDSMILCQYDDNLSQVHSLYFIVLSTTMTCHMFHFISPSLRSGFMESYIISISNSKPVHSKKPQETSRFGRGRLGAPQGLHALGRWWCHPRGRDGLGQRSLPGLANHGLGGVGWRYLGPKKGGSCLVGYETREGQSWKIISDFFLGGGE